MQVAASALEWMTEDRREQRDKVHHRTRGVHPDGRLLPLLVVNTSHGGLMMRCEVPCEEGDRLGIDLPHLGRIVAEVRWSLGGRLGCRFERTLGVAEYDNMLSRLRR